MGTIGTVRARTCPRASTESYPSRLHAHRFLATHESQREAHGFQHRLRARSPSRAGSPHLRLFGDALTYPLSDCRPISGHISGHISHVIPGLMRMDVRQCETPVL